MTNRHGPACLLLILAALFACAAPAVALAQMTLMPAACAGKTGAALDNCVRDATAPQMVIGVEPAKPAENPAALTNCNEVMSIDMAYCLARNEVILECRDRLKYDDFDQCFSNYIARNRRPVRANCEREKPAARAHCTARNAVFTKCLADPLRYFRCLTDTPHP